VIIKCIASMRCQVKGCCKKATDLIWLGQKGKQRFRFLCKHHITEEADSELEECEYIVQCPNCGCHFGV
jgi:hypothetical protein